MKKILTVLICSVMTVISLAGCVKDNSSADSNEVELGSGYTRINGFESMSDLYTCMAYNYIGTIDFERENKTYIKSGNASAKVTVMKNPFKSGYVPYYYQAMHNYQRGVDKVDFRKVVKFETDVYNATAKPQKIGVRMIYSRNYNGGGKSSPIKYYEIEAGKWTTLTYEVMKNIIPEVSTTPRGDDRNGQGILILQVVGMDFLFNRPENTDEDFIFYFDDMRVLEA